MESITLRHVLPDAFADRRAAVQSEIWLCERRFHKGEYTLVEAASGAGKSSLCAFLYGVRTDYTGQILFDGRDCRTFTPRRWNALRRRSLSLLFQDLRLFEELTVLENISIKNDLTRYRTAAEIDRLLEAAGLAEKRDTPAGRLSLGQQQRVAFVRSLCQPFDFALLDEPVSHLDPANGEVLGRLLLEEAARQGAGILATSVGCRLHLPYHQILTL